jgi:hypothetical protein
MQRGKLSAEEAPGSDKLPKALFAHESSDKPNHHGLARNSESAACLGSRVAGDSVRVETSLRVNAVGAAIAEHFDLARGADALGDRDLPDRFAHAQHLRRQRARYPLCGHQDSALQATSGHERKAVHCIDANRNPRHCGRDHPEQTRFRGACMNDVDATACESPPKTREGAQIVRWNNPTLHIDSVDGDVARLFQGTKLLTIGRDAFN